MATIVLGLTTRVAFPQVQGTRVDLAWLGASFALILAFVVGNRMNKHVVR
jgi:hypothetical protein